MKTRYFWLQLIGIGVFAAICFFTPRGVSYFVLAILFARIIVFTRTTRGEKIPSFQKPQKALLVLDMQEAMCGESGDYPQKEEFVERVNQLIDDAQRQGQLVIYIYQDFQSVDFAFCFLAFGGRLLQGTKGVSLCAHLNVVGDTRFVKHQQDAFTSKQLNEYMNKNQVDSVSIVGLDASACVVKTALAAANRGYHVTVMQDGVISKGENATQRALHRLAGKGIAVC